MKFSKRTLHSSFHLDFSTDSHSSVIITSFILIVPRLVGRFLSPHLSDTSKFICYRPTLTVIVIMSSISDFCRSPASWFWSVKHLRCSGAPLDLWGAPILLQQLWSGLQDQCGLAELSAWSSQQLPCIIKVRVLLAS